MIELGVERKKHDDRLTITPFCGRIEGEKKKSRKNEEKMEKRAFTDAAAWAEETFGTADLGDKRRNRRLVQMASAIAADPDGSLPRQMGGSGRASSRPTACCE